MGYADWIFAFVSKHGGNVLGRCREASNEMVAAFPELRVTKGWVTCPWGERQHWWCTAPDGSIVDPTASQFPAIFGYREYSDGDLVEVGRCMECGSDVFSTLGADGEPTSRPTFCDDNCERSFCIATFGEWRVSARGDGAS